MATPAATRTQSFHDPRQNADLRAVVGTLVADLAVLHAAIVGITAKLDADAGITDTNYAALHDPAALTTT